MRFFLFNTPPVPGEHKQEVSHLVEELAGIGKREDFLSELPGGGFNDQCRHIRSREIGTRLNELGGFELMDWAYSRIKKKRGVQLASHLEYAWAGIGKWLR